MCLNPKTTVLNWGVYTNKEIYNWENDPALDRSQLKFKKWIPTC